MGFTINFSAISARERTAPDTDPALIFLDRRIPSVDRIVQISPQQTPN
jgi:hypothetical protein